MKPLLSPLFPLFLPLVVSLLACKGEAKDSGHHEDTATLPTVEILSPAEGATVSGPAVTLTLAIEDFPLVPPEQARRSAPLLGPLLSPLLVGTAWAHESAEDVPEGYVEVRLDGAVVAREAASTIVLSDVEAGPHALEVELLWPDGDAFYPPVEDAVAFTVD